VDSKSQEGTSFVSAHRLRLFASSVFFASFVFIALFDLLPAYGFDYGRYEAADLDALLARKRPQSGLDLYAASALKLTVTLASYAAPCQTGLLRKSMTMAGVSFPEGTQITRCINVRSAKGKPLRMFIQDAVSDVLQKEVPLGRSVTLFAVHLFTTSEGPGLLVNEFSAGDGPPPSQAAIPSCGCGSADLHPGFDVPRDTAGAAVEAAEDGVVVKVETNEKAAVDVPSIGRCGRYVVIKHSYPNGHTIFTRYAQLGRLVDADGQLLTAGAKVGKQDKIGEIGSRKILHFEIRPVVAATMDNGADWTARYGSDPSMEWSRYPAVDPQSFDLDKFAGSSK
jgi:peptidase M23-like protein